LSRKRTKLDTIEANYIYAKVLLAFNKLKGFSDLPIPVRNSLIDSACEEIIERANDSEENIEALKSEIYSYRLNDDEKEKFYSPEFYDAEIEKPKNFNSLLKEKYSDLISQTVSKKEKKIREA
jgi:hypothetical protein